MTPNNDGPAATGPRSASPKAHGLHANIACPFCGILCDDLEVESSAGGLAVRRNGCARAKAGFERKVAGAKPLVGGKPASLEDAVRAAAQLIGKSRLPAFGGLATDVEGMRAVMALADRAGGVVDHALSDAMYRNFKVLQTTGWITSTLTETRNRADLIVIVGSDLARFNPRFFERVVNPAETMFELPSKRSVVFVGRGLDPSIAKGPLVADVSSIDCAPEHIGALAGALRMLLAGRTPTAADVSGVPVASLRALVDRVRKASYAVFVWAPPAFDFDHAELAVEALAGFVRDLNVTQRAAGLSLAGNEGSVTAGAVCAWQSGYPLRVSYETGAPVHDADRYAIPAVLDSGEADLLVWVAAISPDLAPPQTAHQQPRIVLGTPGVAGAETAAVFIPVGTPGADHAGRLIRCDNVVSLPLRDLGRSDLPSVEAVLTAINAAL